MNTPSRLAAIDLGSNSFRLEIGVVENGMFQRTNYLKETVRQGGGLDTERNLTPDAMQSGWTCLARFAEQLKGFKASEVRAVATQTLREAKNQSEFLIKANRILGFPIDVISGREEARLIYEGVAAQLPPSSERRLVIDIGGRSTEIILGIGPQANVLESFRLGSMSWNKRYFPDGQFSKRQFETAEVAAKAVLESAADVYAPGKWDVAYGSAGTVNAIKECLLANGRSNVGSTGQNNGQTAGVVDQDGLDWIRDQLISAQSIDRLKMFGLREDRKPLLAGGLSVMRALFSLLKIKQIEIATGGLRHGLLREMLGKQDHVIDVRLRTVQSLSTKFKADAVHGLRVGSVAKKLYGALLIEDPSMHKTADDQSGNEGLRNLEWAAQLHEIGSRISHSDYHKHGAYILENSDAIGFAASEMKHLSLLVLGHRGKLRKLTNALENNSLRAQLLALRVAVILCHARHEPDLEKFAIKRLKDGKFQLQYTQKWAEVFPQSAFMLHEESTAWSKTQWPIEVVAMRHETIFN